MSIGKTYVVLESSDTGYIVNVARTNEFSMNQKTKMFVYLHKSDYSETLYGFNSFEERLLFEDLVSLKGIGPKTAINILKTKPEILLGFIANKNHAELSKISYGDKNASEIILELSDKYSKFKEKTVSKDNNFDEEVKEALSTLGFSKEQIAYAEKNTIVKLNDHSAKQYIENYNKDNNSNHKISNMTSWDVKNFNILFTTNQKEKIEMKLNKMDIVEWSIRSIAEMPSLFNHNPLANSHPLGIKNDNSLSKGK